MTVEIAVVGGGRIGLPVAERLVAGGHPVRVFDVRPEVEAAAASVGAGWGEPTAAEVVITVLPGSPELRQVMLGGLLDRLDPACTWIDLTSASPALGTELAAAAARRGVAYLDAALGGGVSAAENGSMKLYVGGDAEVLDRVRPILGCFAGQIHHMGEAGSGYLTKLLINLLWFGQAVATGEALLLGQSAGLDPRRLTEVMLDSAASSEFIASYLPSVFAGDYLPNFGLDRCVEELDSLEELAQTRRTPYDVSSAVGRLYHQALDAFGPVDGELLGIAYLEQAADRELAEPSDRPPK
ncbi:NAD(P)-dependent oxidoreductase [Kribbella qitaiheensis]|uniref:NAD(P)-dependent oxidoreductase n=1 Tax=Kribbella qitaiheensis TaxID=1544730 RepID=A0A7G6X5B5_9ACTN|nr:NAD(P)-dependent oxidoreductase [Kribbella qitaiheensis]QNE21430.1 NAD(P)-dependent oxidoreductase [Kribbella qitaiheensis]